MWRRDLVGSWNDDMHNYNHEDDVDDDDGLSSAVVVVLLVDVIRAYTRML
jgi:hypothetical protein